MFLHFLVGDGPRQALWAFDHPLHRSIILSKFCFNFLIFTVLVHVLLLSLWKINKMKLKWGESIQCDLFSIWHPLLRFYDGRDCGLRRSHTESDTTARHDTIALSLYKLFWTFCAWSSLLANHGLDIALMSCRAVVSDSVWIRLKCDIFSG